MNIDRLSMGKDDVLVVSIDTPLPSSELQSRANELKGIFPRNKVLLESGNVSVAVVSSRKRFKGKLKKKAAEVPPRVMYSGGGSISEREKRIQQMFERNLPKAVAPQLILNEDTTEHWLAKAHRRLDELQDELDKRLDARLARLRRGIKYGVINEQLAAAMCAAASGAIKGVECV